jgi:hypothetical protein
MLRCCSRSILGLALVASGAATLPLRAQSAEAKLPVYAVSDSIVVGHVDGRLFNLDVINRRLYGAGNTIVDIDQRRVIGHIADSTPGTVYFVAAEAERGLTNTGIVFNPSTGVVGEHLPIHGDAIGYDPLMRRAFLLSDTIAVVNLAAYNQMPMIQRGRMGRGGMGGGMSGNNMGPQNGGKGDTIIRRLPPVRLTATIVGQIPLAAGGRSAVSDGRGRMYVSRTGADSIAIIDTDRL